MVQLASNVACTCVLLSDATVRCWGAVLGAMDDPAPAADGPEVDVGAPVAKLRLMPTSGDGCVITRDERARCWGADRAVGHAPGVQVGVHSDMGTAPVDVGDLPVAGTVAVGEFHSCAITDRGGVRCWGLGKDGRLGYGSTENIGEKRPPRAAGDVFRID